MIKIRPSMLALALALSQMSVASAATTYTDTYDAGGIKLGGTFWSLNDTASWTFDLTNDGFNPALETITSATVSLDLRDDSGFFSYSYDWLLEFAQLSSGNTVIDTWEVDTGTEMLMLTSLTSLNSSGTLSMTLEAVFGDFYFDQATLNAEAVSAVPVPAAAWLFGSGLIGLAGFARARNKA